MRNAPKGSLLSEQSRLDLYSLGRIFRASPPHHLILSLNWCAISSGLRDLSTHPIQFHTGVQHFKTDNAALILATRSKRIIIGSKKRLIIVMGSGV